jgi:LPXTG-motif cell wall-anchored protein
MTRLAKRWFLLSLVVGALGLAVAPVASAQDVDCDSVGQSEAQQIYNDDPSDPNNLDQNNNGIACEASETSQTTTDTTTTETDTTTTTFANTGFEAWPIAVAGVVCLAGGLLLLMRRRRTT